MHWDETRCVIFRRLSSPLSLPPLSSSVSLCGLPSRSPGTPCSTRSRLCAHIPSLLPKCSHDCDVSHLSLGWWSQQPDQAPTNPSPFPTFDAVHTFPPRPTLNSLLFAYASSLFTKLTQCSVDCTHSRGMMSLRADSGACLHSTTERPMHGASPTLNPVSAHPTPSFSNKLPLAGV